MADRRCDNCGAERGTDGPCPGCGALPAVQLVELDQQAPGEVRRATTADAPQRRVALGVVLVLVALVAGSIMWDSVRSDADEAAGDSAGADDDSDDEEEDDAPSTTSTTRPRSTAPGSPDLGDGPGDGAGPSTSVAPVEGFEDRWLLVVNQNSGEVWQVPLGGGEVTPVLGRTNRPLTQSYPPWFRLVGDALVSRQGGMSLVDGSRWDFNPSRPEGGWNFLIGTTGDDTLVFAAETLTERTPRGEIIAEWDDFGLSGSMGNAVHTSGRNVIVAGPHGVYALDLDTQESRLLLDGSFIVADDEVLVGETCTGWQECEVRALELDDGSVMSTIEPSAGIGGGVSFPGAHLVEAGISPDGERLLRAAADKLELVDLTSGDHVGTFELPAIATDSGQSTAQIVWAPDSSSALIYFTPAMFGGARIDPFLVRIDRDMRNSEPLDRLLDAMHEVTSAESMAIVLSDRPFEPVPEG